MRPHPYYQHHLHPVCADCGSLRSRRLHQSLLWRILHPRAKWR